MIPQFVASYIISHIMGYKPRKLTLIMRGIILSLCVVVDTEGIHATRSPVPSAWGFLISGETYKPENETGNYRERDEQCADEEPFI